MVHQITFMYSILISSLMFFFMESKVLKINIHDPLSFLETTDHASHQQLPLIKNVFFVKINLLNFIIKLNHSKMTVR